MPTVEVLADGLKFPEGPVFDPAGRLWFVELHNGCVCRLQPDGTLARFGTGGVPNGLAADAAGNIYVADKKRKLLKLPAGSEVFETLALTVDGQELAEPNDLCFDPAGNLVFTCPGGSWEKPIGYVCRQRIGGQPVRIAGDLNYPNGLAFDPTGRRLYLAETRKQRLLVSDYDPDGRLELKPFAEVSQTGGPDGLALDVEGNIYAAIFGGGHVAVVDPAGRIIERIELPGKNPTNCAFDPAGALGLVITEAELGRVLSITPAPPGLPLLAGAPAE